jgi:hypothetical protein
MRYHGNIHLALQQLLQSAIHVLTRLVNSPIWGGGGDIGCILIVLHRLLRNTISKSVRMEYGENHVISVKDIQFWSEF